MLPTDILGIIDQLSGYHNFRRDIVTHWHKLFSIAVALFLNARPKARRRRHYARSMLFALITLGALFDDQTVTKRSFAYVWLAPTIAEMFAD